MNPREILGLPKDCDVESIRKRYRELARKHHPDRPGGDADRFKTIQRAYETLMNTDKTASKDYSSGREYASKDYSSGREYASKDYSSGREYASKDYSSGREYDTSSGREYDTFREVFRSFVKRYPTTIVLNKDEVSHGCVRRVRIRDTRDCEVCLGTGVHSKSFIRCRNCQGISTARRHCDACEGRGVYVMEPIPCPMCDGSGSVDKTIERVIQVPPNTPPGLMPMSSTNDVIVTIEYAQTRKKPRVCVELTLCEMCFGFSKRVVVHGTEYEIRARHVFDTTTPIQFSSLQVKFRLVHSEEDVRLLRKLQAALSRIGLIKPLPCSNDNATVLDVHNPETETNRTRD